MFDDTRKGQQAFCASPATAAYNSYAIFQKILRGMRRMVLAVL